MHSSKITILEPTAEIKEHTFEQSLSTLDSLQGKVVGILSNEWTSLATLWPKLSDHLKMRYGVAETFKVRVPTTQPAPEVLLDEVATKSDAVIAGMAN